MNIKHLYTLTLFWVLSALPVSVHSQDIFVPVEVSDGDGMHSAERPVESGPLSLVKRYVSLQAGLYQVVYSFEVKAKQVEKGTRPLEAAWLRRQEINALQGTRHSIPEELPGMAYYDALVTEPTLCTSLNNAVGQYIRTHTNEMSSVISSLVTETRNYSDAQKTEMAQFIAAEMSGQSPNTRRAEEIIYLCLYKLKNEVDAPRNFNFEKTMRQWFNLQAPLLDMWLGPVD